MGEGSGRAEGVLFGRVRFVRDDVVEGWFLLAKNLRTMMRCVKNYVMRLKSAMICGGSGLVGVTKEGEMRKRFWGDGNGSSALLLSNIAFCLRKFRCIIMEFC